MTFTDSPMTSRWCGRLTSTVWPQRTLPSALSPLRQGEGELYTTVSFTEDGELILKAVNPTDAAIPADIALPDAITAAVQATVLTGQPEDVNSLAEPDRVTPAVREGKAESGMLQWSFDPWSVTVLRMRAESARRLP